MCSLGSCLFLSKPAHSHRTDAAAFDPKKSRLLEKTAAAGGRWCCGDVAKQGLFETDHKHDNLSQMLGSLKNLIWAVPIGVACTDVLGSVIRIEGTSMQPSLNPSGSMFQDWVFVDKVRLLQRSAQHKDKVQETQAPADHGLTLSSQRYCLV